MEEKKLVITAKSDEEETAVLSTRLPKKTIAALTKVAEKTGRTKNEITAMCIEYALENLSISNKKNDQLDIIQ